MRNLSKRLEALEKQFVTEEPLLLTMPGGRIEKIPLPPERRGGLLRFYADVMRGERPREAELIRDCIAHNEPGGGHLVNMLKVLLDGPVDLQKETWDGSNPLDASE